MDRLDALRLFCQIVDAGGLAKAAKVLGVSPATVTQGLARLERLYGTRLLERTTRRTAITEAGRILYERAQRLLEEAASAEAAVRGAGNTPRGSLRITLPLGVALTFIYPQLNAFTTRYPDISLDLQINDQVVDLVAGNYDLGLRAGVLSSADVVASPLLRYQRITCASPAYLQRQGTPAHPDELSRHACLTYRHDALPVAWHYWVDGQKTEISVQGPYASNESHALLAMARQGLGITRQPDWLLAEDLREGRLVAVLDDFSAPAHDLPGIYAIVPRRGYRPAKVDVFMEFARQAIAGPPQPA